VNLRPLLALSIFALAACQNMPEPYAPPEQRQPIEVTRTYRVSRVINMDDGDAESHFVGGILGLSGNWRWTGKRPAVRIPVRGADKLHLVADFAIADATFKVTGPVKIVFYLNDTVIANGTYDAPGRQHVDQLLPAGLVKPNSDVVLSMEIDKVWVSPNDGTELGFILERIGLREAD
jgi:hypothetical protein